MGNSKSACDQENCQLHFHLERQEPAFTNGLSRQQAQTHKLETQNEIKSEEHVSDATLSNQKESTAKEETKSDLAPEYDPEDHGYRRIIRNFTPS